MGDYANLFGHLQDLMTADAGFFVSYGINVYRIFAVLLVAWFGITWALGAHHQRDRLPQLVFMLALGFAMVYSYNSPLGVFGGLSFHALLTEQGRYFANLLNDGTTDSLFGALDTFMKALKPPTISSLFNLDVASIIEWTIVYIAMILMQAVIYFVIAWGYIATAVGILLGPVFIPFVVLPNMEWMFWNWLKFMLQYSFYPVVANAYLWVFGKLMIGYMTDHAPPYDGAMQFALILPMLMLMGAFTLGLMKVPGLVSDLFSGRSGGAALPSFLS